MSPGFAMPDLSTSTETSATVAIGTGRLILLRHGRTAWNATGRFQGQADPPLDDVGLAQATDAARALRALDPDVVVSSDLWRAAQTAALIATACNVPVIFEPALREVALGRWQGLTAPAAAAAFPAEYAAWLSGRDVRRGGGETEREAGQRAVPALLAAVQRCRAGRTVLVVSHGLVLRSGLRQLAGRVTFERPLADSHLGNGEWISVRPGLAR